MEYEIEEQIQTLARSLKGMHLAATMEEALERARVIILQSKGTSDQPLKQVIQKEEHRVQQDVEQGVQDVQKIDVTLDKMKDELSQVEEKEQENKKEVQDQVHECIVQVKEDVVLHKKEQKDFEIVHGDLTKKKQALDDIEEFVEMAKEIQK